MTGQEPPFVSADSDEGMLREAHDLLRFGVVQWRSSTFAWVASDLIERLAARLPEPADVIEPPIESLPHAVLTVLAAAASAVDWWRQGGEPSVALHNLAVAVDAWQGSADG